MSVRDLLGWLAEAFPRPEPREASVQSAIAEVVQAREAARSAAEAIESKDPKLARELYKAADTLSRISKRMWSL